MAEVKVVLVVLGALGFGGGGKEGWFEGGWD